MIKSSLDSSSTALSQICVVERSISALLLLPLFVDIIDSDGVSIIGVEVIFRGDQILVLLKLDQLYDSLYDMLNQKYLSVDGQKYCKICIGGESIRCPIDSRFK